MTQSLLLYFKFFEPVYYQAMHMLMLCLQTSGPYAAVVIAAPLEFSDIRFQGVQLPRIPPRKFQSTISTFVRGCLNGTYFGVKQPPQGNSSSQRQ